MERIYSTSVNIVRDTNKKINYIPTPNSKKIVNQIVNDFKIGIRSFNIVGTYGTGKSSFLLAFEQSILGSKKYFDTNFKSKTSFDFIKIVGSFTSLINCFSEELKTEDEDNINNILIDLYNRYKKIEGEDKILFILIDEFGKFLEYANKNNPEKEIYFLQQLAEFCNNQDHNIVLITTVHQSIESYSYSMSNSHKQEWTKVKGRFKEITFNEPVEQLLYLAAEQISQTSVRKPNKNEIKKCLDICLQTKAFDFNEEFIDNISDKIYPLDVLSASTMTLSLQRYGQNERSLFSFLESTDYTGIKNHDYKTNPFYNLSNVFDYLIFNFYSFLSSKYNPDFAQWASIKSSIEEVERTFEDDINTYIKTVKAIGLLNIFSASGSKLDFVFLINYLELCCGIKKADEIINNLESKNIIRYRKHSRRYVLFEGTDLDIENAINEAGNKVNQVENIADKISQFADFKPIFAKQYTFEYGTPRFFEFKITSVPIENEIPKGEIDGYINFIFNDRITEENIRETSKRQEEAIFYCYFKNSNEIKNILFEIEKIINVIDENHDDKIAKRELNIILEANKAILNRKLRLNVFSDSENIKWFHKGNKVNITSETDFKKYLSQICKDVYSDTPIYFNELLNKNKISPSIRTAKRNYFKALTNNWAEFNLGFDEDKYPPEKTIYLSLLKENGILPLREISTEEISINQKSSFYKLWMISLDFLNRAKLEPLKISDFKETLSKRPFKLKQGLIDFWIPTFLFLKRDDFAIFNEESYIPNLSEENLELLAKYPEKYSIKTFDIEGVKLDIFNSYRKFLNIATNQKFNNESFIETIKPFIIFYKQLPEYSKNTKRLSPTSIKIRTAIANSKDPEDTFFEVFPNALGFTINSLQNDQTKLQSYTVSLQNAVKELRTAYDELVSRFEAFICIEVIGQTIDFEAYKLKLQNRFSKLKKHLLLSNQKSFVQRLDSTLDDKKAWLNSIAQSVTGKTLENFSDEDEILLYEKFKAMILELDSLTKISKSDIDESKEEVIGVKIDSFFSKIDPKVVRVPKNKSKEIEELKNELKNKLGADNTSNIAAVLNLLKELLQ